MKFFRYIILFLIINFGALAIGTILMNNGPSSEWYLNLNKAPWTPPGWFFGFAWTTIMICFSIYMAKLVTTTKGNLIVVLFTLQFIFNVFWNYFFFKNHMIFASLIVIITLTFLVGIFTFNYRLQLKKYTWLIVPYFSWLIVATSLNAYVYLNN